MKKHRLYLPFLCLLVLAAVSSCSHHDKTVILPTPPVHKQVDSFFSWRLIDTVGQTGIEDIWFTSASKGFYLGGDNYIYQSPDSGKTWTKLTGTATTNSFVQLFFVDAQYGFAASNNQLEVTRDGGNTWAMKSLPTINAFNITFTTRARGFCGDAQTGGLYKTTDTGNTWTNVYTQSGAQYGYFPAFADPSKGFVVTGNGYVASSSDSGNSWNFVSYGSFPRNRTTFNTLQFLDASTGLYAGLNGLQETYDAGTNWISINPIGGNINIVKAWDIDTIYYLSDSVIYKTVDGGYNWTTGCKLINDIFSGMHFFDRTNAWACTFKGRIVRLDQ